MLTKLTTKFIDRVRTGSLNLLRRPSLIFGKPQQSQLDKLIELAKRKKD